MWKNKNVPNHQLDQVMAKSLSQYGIYLEFLLMLINFDLGTIFSDQKMAPYLQQAPIRYDGHDPCQSNEQPKAKTQKLTQTSQSETWIIHDWP